MRLAVIGLAGFGLVATLVWAALSPKPTSRGSPKERRPTVTVAPISVGNVRRIRHHAAPLLAQQQVVVVSQVAGQVTELTVGLGDRVSRAEVIASVADDRLKHLAEAATAALRVAKAERQAAEAELELARQALSRTLQLEPRGVVPPAQLDAARAEVRTSEARLRVCEAEVAEALANDRRARAEYARTTIRARWRGGASERWVAYQHIQEGDVVQVDDPIVTLIEPAPLRAYIYSPESDYPYLREGLSAVLTSDAYPQRRWLATVVAIASAFDPQSRQIQVELEVENSAGELAPGMFTVAELVLEEVTDALVVPRAAVTRLGPLEGIFVLDDEDRVFFVPVEPGIVEDERIQVTPMPDAANVSLVRNGRSVVVLGHQLLRDGLWVRPQLEQRP